MAATDLTAARLREVLHYDPDTGIFTCAIDSTGKGARRKAGDPAGGRQNRGYITIRLSEGRFLAHRLAWLYMTGEWPARGIDHINGMKADNRWLNLRDVSQAENMQNVAAPFGKTASGLLGVTWAKRRRQWQAQITAGGKYINLGYFRDKDAAGAAYLKAKAALHSAPRLFDFRAS